MLRRTFRNSPSRSHRSKNNTGKKRPKPYTHELETKIIPIKISLKEGEDALRQYLSFLEQQDNDNINIRVDDLSVVRRLISQVSNYRKL